ncbi:glutamine-hydrolyzing carbamoyl-phosphate synthase small subunit [Brachybacterium muris]|uniref:Carbamoyl phosphate synthase small chain n=1 Tax=Brachybacterium muris UCD-AY4 TaxID=1249481 RepID=A0A022KS37_9MICO|nr:glutamine-hydrolyzing carbamoyl-phosphate synthase small subunit [Brachybacterium muris]EYT48484.1 carbamoyl phosphate synthase small subunit [Brachybacterium muris UCD-AY4]MBM7500522.1 carbamoyl-phosphate synthase small subunit [Brachybacterium muris]MCT1430670.1 glutamine-hydrolyzing carbamoyl-phosphate synthase small subunit [Brachybacterium muris]MCT1654706.1 glutamine-hydrolyzing carbamoyl-phosphate synthase small subunit [Brachybacterium muris]MCT1998286.1 glutamine-hydrolyzing carbam
MTAQPTTTRRSRNDPAVLILEDGTVVHGTAYGARGQRLGEVVFSTGMTGYQETLTDPSYAGQIVVQTAPHIGNTGVNTHDMESRKVWVRGYAVREASRIPSNWRSEQGLEELLAAEEVVGIAGIDTRMVTRILREHGAMRGGVFSGEALEAGEGALLERVRSAPTMEGSGFLEEVTIAQPVLLEPEGEAIGTVAAVDLGIKGATPRSMLERGLRVHLLPATTTLEELLAASPDAVFFSNGPGDPATADHQVELLRGVLDAGLPYFGICLGNQMLGRALGFGTYKLKYGHRGINQPVLDKATGKVEITAHNHGFAVDIPLDGQHTAPHDGGRYGRVEVSHVGLNDDVVEGIRCLDIPAFSVQYHPEAAAGPHDAAHLFDRLAQLVHEHRSGSAAGKKES